MPRAYADHLPAAIVHQPYHHQLTQAGGMGCTGYQPSFHLAGGTLPEGLRLHADGRILGEPTRIEAGAATVRVATPCSETVQEWNWAVRGAPMLFVEPAEITLDSRNTTAAALVSSSWEGLTYSISTADGQPLPRWLRVRPKRGRTPPAGSPLTADQVALIAEPSLAPPGAVAELLIHTWRGSGPAALVVRFGPPAGKAD